VFDWGVVSIDEADDLEFLAVLGAVSVTVGAGSGFLGGLSERGLFCLAGVPMPNAEAKPSATAPANLPRLDGASSPVEPS
jgi:hypothetical protein